MTVVCLLKIDGGELGQKHVNSDQKHSWAMLLRTKECVQIIRTLHTVKMWRYGNRNTIRSRLHMRRSLLCIHRKRAQLYITITESVCFFWSFLPSKTLIHNTRRLCFTPFVLFGGSVCSLPVLQSVAWWISSVFAHRTFYKDPDETKAFLCASF